MTDGRKHLKSFIVGESFENQCQTDRQEKTLKSPIIGRAFENQTFGQTGENSEANNTVIGPKNSFNKRYLLCFEEQLKTSNL